MTNVTWGRFGAGVLMLALPMVWLVAAPGAATADESDFVRVKVDTANVRQGPSTRHELSTQAFENEPLEVLTRKGQWIRARNFEGGEGWIYAPLTDDKPAAIVRSEVANVRSAPGTQNAIVFTAERGVPFRVLGEEGSWINVEHSDGDRGWIHKSLIWGH